ncbi:uncharacterized protein ASCRUDRAFT_74768 [Ascoidea rubescens DSM 1968]|uniref:Uncharacterized protein n=1 Tax=Ascoidea rubescens DSM 1968 TaxID=1344418 RepID=A0A1D2VL87_9ASCO|nr:hypothetical protein ASCRUDRAFT_74768 [Ascoidea rubescens DSM 1968]ODV62378.1 hypothetical protein ASCRUDRAFT_74768 [Ascoidea rubescens DSM 1968]
MSLVLSSPQETLQENSLDPVASSGIVVQDTIVVRVSSTRTLPVSRVFSTVYITYSITELSVLTVTPDENGSISNPGSLETIAGTSVYAGSSAVSLIVGLSNSSTLFSSNSASQSPETSENAAFNIHSQNHIYHFAGHTRQDSSSAAKKLKLGLLFVGIFGISLVL